MARSEASRLFLQGSERYGADLQGLYRRTTSDRRFLSARRHVGARGRRRTYLLPAEAVTDCQLLLINRRRVMARAAREAPVARELCRLIGHELERVRDHVLLLIKNAEQRVASFLLEMAGPASEGNTINLPMTRQDIGEYLGLSIETVSRTLAHLEATAAIAVHIRQVMLRDCSALRRLNA